MKNIFKNKNILKNKIFKSNIKYSSTKLRFYSNEVWIVSAARTPVATFQGSFSSLSGPELGSIAIKGALQKANIDPSLIEEVYLGNVVSANVGQAPATQASIKSGIPNTVPCTTINKVCASGMKSIIIGAQSIMLGLRDVVLTGGFESMSNVPYYIPKARQGLGYGHTQILDGVLKDGLWDSFDNHHMGSCGEDTAKKYNISRQQQDEYAISSYKRADHAWKSGYFNDEVVPVTIQDKKGPKEIKEDEQHKIVNYEKMPTLKTAFEKDGTITAANASKLNDGASAVILMSSSKAKKLGLKPLAKIIGFADAQGAPIDFPTIPSRAIPPALKMAGLNISDISFFEINEAFSVVPLANMKILGIDHSKVNVNGGAVALGHPIGSSGSRIVVSLVNILKQNSAKYGVASICNGGGGASTLVIERI